MFPLWSVDSQGATDAAAVRALLQDFRAHLTIMDASAVLLEKFEAWPRAKTATSSTPNLGKLFAARNWQSLGEPKQRAQAHGSLNPNSFARFLVWRRSPGRDARLVFHGTQRI